MKSTFDIIIIFFIRAVLSHQAEATILAPRAMPARLSSAIAFSACGNATLDFPAIVGIDVSFFDAAVHFGHRSLCFLFCLPNV